MTHEPLALKDILAANTQFGPLDYEKIIVGAARDLRNAEREHAEFYNRPYSPLRLGELVVIISTAREAIDAALAALDSSGSAEIARGPLKGGSGIDCKRLQEAIEAVVTAAREFGTSYDKAFNRAPRPTDCDFVRDKLRLALAILDGTMPRQSQGYRPELTTAPKE